MPTAIAIVTIRVECKSNWDAKTTLDQVARQATADAIGQLATAFKGRTDMSIIGKPKITAVHTELGDGMGHG